MNIRWAPEYFVIVGWRMQKSEVLLSFADAVEAACTDFLSSLLVFEDTAFCGTVLRVSRLAVSTAVCWA